MAKVWKDAYFTPADKTKLLIALAIADYSNENGYAWPAIETLAHKARTSTRGAQEACREMEKDGMLRVQFAGGRNGTNLYYLTPATVAPPCNGAALKAAEEAALGCTQSVRKQRNHQEPSEFIFTDEQKTNLNTKTTLDKPPTLSEAVTYGATIGFDAKGVEAWWDHFESNGWKVSGKTPMKNWQAAMRTGKRVSTTLPTPKRNGNKPAKEIDWDKQERL